MGEKNDSSLDLPSIDLASNKRRKTAVDYQYICLEPNCGKSIDKKDQIEAHERWHSVEVLADKKCNACQLGFRYVADLKCHLASMGHYEITGQSLGGEQKYTCDHSGCNREFFNEILLRKHKRTIHSPNVSVVTCEDCEYVGRNKDNDEDYYFPEDQNI